LRLLSGLQMLHVAAEQDEVEPRLVVRRRDAERTKG
jgi:hypothetical protein